LIQETPLEPQISSFDPRDRKTYYFKMTPFRRVLTPTLQVAFKVIADLRVQGAENLPRSGAVILASNHLTNYDVFPLQFALPRPIFFMGKQELFRPGLMDAALRQMGGFPVQRGAQDEWSVQHARRVLDHGLVLGMFPEGSRNRGTGLKPAKTGIARLALATGSPIVPVALHGPQYMFRHFPRRTPLHLSVGEPIYPERRETILGLTERVMFSMAEMLPPETRGVYSRRPPGF
jgi:1-acyl-sn-glycerol-3-phosphate acyltransferase